MKVKTTKSKIKLGFAAAAVFIGFFVWLTYSNMQETSRSSKEELSASEGLLLLENIRGDLQDIETGMRDFVISGDTNLLAPFNKGLAALKTDTIAFRKFYPVRKKSPQRAEFTRLINQRVKNAKYTVEFRKIYGTDTSATYDLGWKEMSLINQVVNSLENNSRDILRQSSNSRQMMARRTTLQFLALAIIFNLLLLGFYIIIIRDFKMQQRNDMLLRFNASLVRNISDFIITTDNSLNISNWNIHAEELYGYKESEVFGKNLNEVLGITGKDSFSPWLPHEGIQREHWKGELLHRHKNGSAINAEVNTSVIRLDDGERAGTVTVIRDITERKAIEKRLKQLTERLEREVNLKSNELTHVYERITDAFIALDNDWHYTYLNSRAAELHGKKPADLIGQVIWEAFPDVVNEPFYHALRQAKETQQAMRVELYHSNTGRWYEDLIYPTADGMSVYYHDITEKKKAELSLRASEKDLKVSNERFNLVAKATNDAVWDWDMEENVIWGNESFNKVYEIETGKKVRFRDFTLRLHPEDKENVISGLKNAMKVKATSLTEEFRLKVRDGNYRSFLNRAYILYNSEGKAYRTVGAMQDITTQKYAQEQLLLEKDLSDSIIKSLPGIFYLVNADGKYLRWNKNMEDVSGYSAEEIEKKQPLDFFEEAARPLISEKIAEVFSGHDTQVEANLVTKDNRKIPYYFSGILIQYEGESCLMGVGIDLSEKIDAQEKVKASEENYRTLIEQASDGIFISNNAGDYLDVNTSASLLTGYSKEELLKMNMREIIYGNEFMDDVYKPEELNDGKVIRNEKMMKQKNGDLIDVEISAKHLPDGRFQAIVRDITERKKSEEELRISEHKYRLLFEQNPMPMWMISLPERNFMSVNEAAIEFYGYSEEEFLRMNIKDIRPHGEADTIISTYNSGINNTGIWDHKKKDGTIVKVNVITHDIIYQGKHAKLVLANDVTEKISAEEKLKKSYEELRQLATHLQHIRENERTHMAREIHDELGEQLTGLKMDISWLNKKLINPDPPVSQKITEILRLIDTTVKTVRRIATQLRPSILDDLGLIAAMEWQSEEFEKRSEIITQFTSNVPSVSIPPDIATGIFRVFQESLTNVLRHAHATSVEATLNYKDGLLSLHIKDDGVGFNASEIENKKTLGLLGMKERTLLMGGSYEITSKPGLGTSVVIIVPVI